MANIGSNLAWTNRSARWFLSSLMMVLLLASPSIARAEESRDPSKSPLLPGIVIKKAPVSGATSVTIDPGKLSSSDDAFVIQGTRFANDPQMRCLEGAAFFSVTPRGLTILFKSPRDTLPFSIAEQTDRADQSVSMKFVTSKCRVTIRAVKEIKQGETWHRLAPVD